jgi:hypothetical protein
MIGAAVLRYRASGTTQCLDEAEAIAGVALRRYAGRYFEQAPAFNAIFFRNLLLLHQVSGDHDLRGQILAAMRSYADQAWSRRQSGDLLPGAHGPLTLLDQSALVQVLALSAWSPVEYTRLA